MLVGVLAPSAGILGALLWPAVQRHFGLSSLRVLVLTVIAVSVIPLYGAIGLLAPRGARWGLRVPEEMFVLAVYFGIMFGGFQSYARALYAEIIPPGEEARWYGLFSITDKVGVLFYKCRPLHPRLRGGSEPPQPLILGQHYSLPPLSVRSSSAWWPT
jgi:MFS transporter, UMF1 family